jgi:heme O synthase-like polyprenyltransferase
MTIVKPWISYTLIRLALFAGVLALLLLLGVPGWIAAIFAAIIALCIAFLAFGGLRERMVADLAASREKARAAHPVSSAESDESVEDAS